MHLHYFVKLENSCFSENCNDGKARLKKFYLLTLILLIVKRCNSLTLTSRCTKFNQESMYQTL